MSIHPRTSITAEQIFESEARLFRETRTHAPGPEGVLPITPEMLLTQPSGNLFPVWDGSPRACSILNS